MNTKISSEEESNEMPAEFMKEWPGYLYPELLPAGFSLDFQMTKDNLFAVWYLPTEHQKLIMNFKGPSIKQKWCLADEDSPLEQIQKYFGNMKVVAVVSLSELESLKNRLEKPGFWKSMFSSPKIYFVKEHGKSFWTAEKTGTVLFEGDFSDIDEVILEGLSVFNNKKYRGLADARGAQPGHPLDWVRFMSDAKGAMLIREVMIETLGHDGSK